jgi:hypothetical protein
MTGVHFESANLEMLSRRREVNSKKKNFKNPMHTCRKDTLKHNNWMKFVFLRKDELPPLGGAQSLFFALPTQI